MWQKIGLFVPLLEKGRRQGDVANPKFETRSLTMDNMYRGPTKASLKLAQLLTVAFHCSRHIACHFAPNFGLSTRLASCNCI